MHRWCSKLRSMSVKSSSTLHSLSSTRRIFHSSPPLYQSLHFSPNNSRFLFNASSQTNFSLSAFQFIRSSPLPLSVNQVRYVSSRERRKRRKPMTPVTSKLKKVKMKCYSSYKSRFWLMHDGNIKRRKEGKRHNAHLKGYGMTESTAVATRGFNTEDTQNYSSVGLLAPSMEAKVVDWINGSFLPPGRCGELLLRGPALMKGYLNNTEATTFTIDHEAWLHTGDIVYFDREGYLYVIDRLKEMIKYKGFQIAPADLEAVLITHPDVLEVAVAGVVDEECGEIPVAFVVKKPGSSLSQIDVMDFVAKQVAPYKKIRRVVFKEAIPKSAAGKILRRELKKQLTSKL